MAKIKSIEEGTFTHVSRGYKNDFDGYIITCDDDTTIKVGIDCGNGCGNWGYLHSEDDFEDFIGATITQVSVVDEALESTPVPDIYDGGTMFVNIETTAGKFQLVAYNEHNGYYSHEAVLVENGVTIESQNL